MYRLHLLGGLALEGPDGPLEGRIAQRSRQALLALLATPVDRPVSRDKLIALLWPESPSKQARRHLSDALYDVRQELGEQAVVAVGDDLRLDPDAVVTDVSEFETAMSKGDLEAAVALFRGPFLDGIHLEDSYEFEEWNAMERERLEHEYRAALEGLAEGASANGEHEEAVEWWRELAARDPFSSRYALALMKALAAAGERAKAIQHAATHEALIRQELDVPPEPEIVDLVDRLRGTPSESLRIRRDASTAEPATGSDGESTPERSIAVLPFVNMSPDSDTDYFSDGMAEELINVLARIPGLKVAARTSSFAFKGKRLDVRDLADRLKVAYVLEGSVRKAGDRLRITAQLVEAARGYHLWTETYDRGLEDVFAVQEEIALAIADALQVQLGVGSAPLVRHGTSDVDAYTLYLEGRYHLNKRKAPAYRKAVECFERAIELDPEYAFAHSGLADLYLLFERYSVLSPKEAVPRAREAAERAVELAPDLAEALTSLAYVRFLGEWNPKAAEPLYRRALARDPRYVTAHHWYGWFLLQQGRFEDALVELRRGLELEPLSLILNANVGTVLYMMRRYDEAIDAARRTLELDSRFVVAHQWLGRACELSGRIDEGVAVHRRALEILGGDDPESLGSLGHARALAGDREGAAAALARLEALSGRRFVSRYWVALVRLGLGESDRALDELEQAFDEGFDWCLFVAVDPMFDPLRKEPRFQSLVPLTRSGTSTTGA